MKQEDDSFPSLACVRTFDSIRKVFVVNDAGDVVKESTIAIVAATLHEQAGIVDALREEISTCGKCSVPFPSRLLVGVKAKLCPLCVGKIVSLGCTACGKELGIRNITGVCRRCRPKISKEEKKRRASAACKAWRAANSEKYKAACRAWKDANPERRKANVKAWRAAHPEKPRDNVKAWRAAHPEKYKAIRRRQHVLRSLRLKLKKLAHSAFAKVTEARIGT